MSIWNQENYIEAWNYACSAHNGQFVLGRDIPYINHIGLVAMEAMAAITHSSTINAPDLLVVCALLHDTIEDTTCTYDEITKEFGADVANGVLALSKNKNLPSKDEQMRDSIDRIKKQPQEIWIVKLADRITNLQPPPEHWSTVKISNYRSEAMTILKELGGANSYLAKRLKAKIDNYPQYL